MNKRRTAGRGTLVAALLFLGSLVPLQAAEPPRAVAPAPEQADREAMRLRVERLSASVRNAAALRQVKRVQHALSHYREAGLWREAGALFTRDATAQLAGAQLRGRDAIAAHFAAEAGTARGPLPRGRLNTHLVLTPVVTLDAAGERARGRWHEVSMTGVHGESADWAGGIYENEYAIEDGAWKIARLHYYPSFAGPYDTGWRNVDRSDTVTVVPFHYTPDGAGTPIPAVPRLTARDRVAGGEAAQKRRVQQLRGEVARLRDEALVQNLQNAWGYYFDRRMWDDVADLFADGGTLELGGRGVHVGREGIRRGLAALGPQGLAEGVLNDHLQLQPVITVAPDGRSARVRATELAATGQHGGGAWWGINIHENRYVKVDGVWRLQSAHVFPRMKTDYFQGWAKSALPPPGPSPGIAPDRPSTLRHGSYPDNAVPAMHFASPARPVRAARVLPASKQTLEELLLAAERELDAVVAVEAGENISNAYGYYIDEFLWDNTADLFSEQGSKELSYIGNYIGRERVRASLFARYGNRGRRPGFMAIHQKTMPYVTVAPDGRSAKLRARLFQMNSSLDGDGSYISGVYENGIVKERGVWKLSSMDLDYAWTAPYTGGWARLAATQPRLNAPPPQISVAPDGPLRGAIFPPYPGLATMAFHFRNPVSGREPPELLPP